MCVYVRERWLTIFLGFGGHMVYAGYKEVKVILVEDIPICVTAASELPDEEVEVVVEEVLVAVLDCSILHPNLRSSEQPSRLKCVDLLWENM